MRTSLNEAGNMRHGGAAVAVLVSVLLLASVVTSALVGTSSSAAVSRGALRRVQTLYAAESGANRALWEVGYGGQAWTGWTSLPDGAKQCTGTIRDTDDNTLASYTVQITDPAQETSTITATGSRETGYDGSLINRQVSVNIERDSGGGGGWFQYGVYASATIRVQTLAMIDSYDSSQGSYWATRGSDAQVAANSTMPGAVSVGSWAVIKGDAYVAPDGDPDSGITGYITGERGVLASGDAPPTVEAPTDISHDIGTVSLVNDDEITLTQDTVCDSVVMLNDAVIKVQGDVRLYVRGNFEARNLVRIKIPEGSSLTMYVGGRFIMQNGAVVNWQTKTPEQCIIYGLETCNEITVQDVAIVYAAVYAPQANFTCKNLAGFYGAMIADSATIKNLAALHFDKAVGDLAPETLPPGGGQGGGGQGGDGDPWSILTWRITR